MNKNKMLILLLIVVIIMAGAAVLMRRAPLAHNHSDQSAKKTIYYCPMHPTYTSDRPGSCPICNMNLVKRGESEKMHMAHGSDQPREMTLKELMSMKPGEICLLHKCKMGQCMIAMTEEIARAGKCPHCGEDLGVVIKDLLPDGYANVKLDPEKQQLIGVKTEAVKKIPMTKTIRTAGRIAYDPALYQAEEEYLQARESLKKAEGGTIQEIKEQAAKLVESARIKLKLMGLSDEIIQELETAGKADRSLLYSEAGGTAWLYAPIYEYEMPLVKIGNEVEVEVPAVSGKKWKGIIRAVDTVIDSMTRTINIRAVLDNPEGLLKPQMYVNAVLRIDLGDVLAVSEEAVFRTGEKNVVFVSKPDGRFEPREVTLGVKTDRFYEIKNGLSEGEMAVTSGNFLIDSESRLTSALEEIGGAGGHQHGA